MSEAPHRRTRLGAVAGLLGAAAAFTFIIGAGPAPSVFQLAGANDEDISGNCDEVEHANDPECAGTPATDDTSDDGSTTTTVDDNTTTTNAPGDTTGTTDIRSIDADGAGTVLVAVEGSALRIVAATPTSGWSVEVEQATGREVEVDFRSGSKRVQVNVELEDGEVRVRVRPRDDAADDNVGTGNVDNSGPGNSGDDDNVDNSGPGNSGDDDSIDDDDDDDDDD